MRLISINLNITASSGSGSQVNAAALAKRRNQRNCIIKLIEISSSLMKLGGYSLLAARSWRNGGAALKCASE